MSRTPKQSNGAGSDAVGDVGYPHTSEELRARLLASYNSVVLDVSDITLSMVYLLLMSHSDSATCALFVPLPFVHAMTTHTVLYMRITSHATFPYHSIKVLRAHTILHQEFQTQLLFVD